MLRLLQRTITVRFVGSIPTLHRCVYVAEWKSDRMKKSVTNFVCQYFKVFFFQKTENQSIMILHFHHIKEIMSVFIFTAEFEQGAKKIPRCLSLRYLCKNKTQVLSQLNSEFCFWKQNFDKAPLREQSHLLHFQPFVEEDFWLLLQELQAATTNEVYVSPKVKDAFFYFIH